jgi:hypothetical protein
VDNNLYKSLFGIGLEDYLRQKGNNNIYQETYILKIDFFVENLPKEQKKILKEKISKKKSETHAQHNDIFHEISIACAFYDKVNFLQENNKTKASDFCSNGIYIEVKTINNSNIERERQDELNKGRHSEVSPALTQAETEKIKKEYIDCLGKKFTDHINKAKEQLNSRGGHIWVVYAIDSPPQFHEKIDKEVENKFDEIIKELQTKNLCIRYINFESLREKIASL